MDADKVRELIAETRERVEIRNQVLQPMAMGGNTTTAILMACELSRRLAPQLADACEVLLAERDKLVERNWYLEHGLQHDVLKLRERVAELEAVAGQLEELAKQDLIAESETESPYNAREYFGRAVAYRRAAELLAKKEPTNG